MDREILHVLNIVFAVLCSVLAVANGYVVVTHAKRFPFVVPVNTLAALLLAGAAAFNLSMLGTR